MINKLIKIYCARLENKKNIIKFNVLSLPLYLSLSLSLSLFLPLSPPLLSQFAVCQSCRLYSLIKCYL